MRVVGELHSRVVFGRRVRVLAAALADLIPRGGTVLDVGCGDGSIGYAIGTARPDLTVHGLEVLERPHCHIPVEPFDGASIPRPDAAVDFVLLVDVVHHADDPERLLAEATRVAGAAVVIKDHLLHGLLAGPTLRLMDRVGNAHHGVAMPFNYWTPEQWREAFARLDLGVAARNDDLGLYPFPASLVFGRRLHFAARLERRWPEDHLGTSATKVWRARA